MPQICLKIFKICNEWNLHFMWGVKSGATPGSIIMTKRRFVMAT